PPSSSTVFFKCRPACSATWLPARSEPVSVTARTRGSAMTVAAASFERINARNSPSGKPASWKIASIPSAQRVTLGACFKSPAFPHRLRALRVRAARPALVGGERQVENSFERRGRGLGEGLERFAGGGVDRGDGHDESGS